MHLPVISLLFLLPSLCILASAQDKPFVMLVSILLFLSFLLTASGVLLKRKKNSKAFATTPFLLGYTALFVFSTCSLSVLSSFSPWLILYNTITLIAYGSILSSQYTATLKNLLMLAGASLSSFVVSLLLFPFSLVPFSFLFLVNASLPIGVVLWESRKRKGKASASRLSLQSMLAHEIRTPLTIMQTTTNLLLEEIPGPLNTRQKQFVKSNYEYTQRLITFSENMLTLLKFEKEFEIKGSEKLNIRHITQDIVAFFGPLLQIKGQTIRYSFPALLNNPIGDESLIRQVFINLIHNAVKHTREGGYIVISVTQDDNQMVVSISDNGEGVEGEGRENLFREFYQEKGSHDEFQDGFGLGLSIARQIIQKHGGNVYITSVKDKGTIVSFTLPAKAVR